MHAAFDLPALMEHERRVREGERRARLHEGKPPKWRPFARRVVSTLPAAVTVRHGSVAGERARSAA